MTVLFLVGVGARAQADKISGACLNLFHWYRPLCSNSYSTVFYMIFDWTSDAQLDKYALHSLAKHRKLRKGGTSISVNGSDADRINPLLLQEPDWTLEKPAIGYVRRIDDISCQVSGRIAPFPEDSAPKFSEYCLKNHRPTSWKRWFLLAISIIFAQVNQLRHLSIVTGISSHRWRYEQIFEKLLLYARAQKEGQHLHWNAAYKHFRQKFSISSAS